MGDIQSRVSQQREMNTPRMLVVLFVGLLSFAIAEDTSIMAEIENEAPPVPKAKALDYDIETAVSHLHRLVPDYLKMHTKAMRVHAQTLSMLQAQTGDKALPGKAYKHNFARARAAIKAALSALTSDLRTGHAHDKNMLNNARAAAARRIKDNEIRNKGRVTKFRRKACPTKRAEEKANMRKSNAKGAVQTIKTKRICDVTTTWKSMGVRTTQPKLGSAMYNKWAKTRADYVRKMAQYNAAIKAHKAAVRRHDKAMTSFKVALDLETKNTYRSCRDSHKDYNRLKRDVARNVATRKEVFIATLIVGCYADQLSSNGGAKACADRKRRASTSQWNIHAGTLAPCKSRTRLAQRLGPKGWQPTRRNCKF